MVAEQAAADERERLLQEREAEQDELLNREIEEENSYFEDQETIIDTFNVEFPEAAKDSKMTRFSGTNECCPRPGNMGQEKEIYIFRTIDGSRKIQRSA